MNSPAIRFAGFTEDWEQRKWIDTIDISTKMVDPKNGKYDFLPHIGPGNIESFSGRLYDNVNTVKEDNLISGKFHFNKGDVIYGKINPHLGKYIFAPFEGLASADAYVLNAKNGFEQTFLFILLQTRPFFKYSVSVSMRSGMPKINRDELNEYKFNAPSGGEQKRIGEYFLLLDRLINLHQREHDKTVIIKKALLEKMFPKDGEDKPEIRFAGFTGAWEQRKLGELVEFFSGLTYSPHNVVSDGTLVLRSSNVNEGAIINADNVFVEAECVNVSNVQIGDIVVVVRNGSRNLIGKHALIKRSMPNTVIGAFMTGLRCHIPEFTNALLDTHHFDNEIKKNLGATINQITTGGFKKMTFFVPEQSEQKKIGRIFTLLDNLIALHQRELTKLQNIKKALLEKMFV